MNDLENIKTEIKSITRDVIIKYSIDEIDEEAYDVRMNELKKDLKHLENIKKGPQSRDDNDYTEIYSRLKQKYCT